MTTTTPKHRLRWYQYSLRSLFVLTVLVAVGGSWFAVKRQQVERQRAAVKAIREAGGSVEYDYHYDTDGMPIPNATPPGPAWLQAWLGDDFFADVVHVAFGGRGSDSDLRRVGGLTQLRSLKLVYTEVTDVGLEHIKGLTHLRRLEISEAPITDTGVQYLEGMTQLEVLEICNTQVTSTGLRCLEGMTQLRYLYLAGERITDAGLVHLERLTQLRDLFVISAPITDVGLEHLNGLTGLELLWLGGTKVTDEGVKKLQRALPNCEIARF